MGKNKSKLKPVKVQVVTFKITFTDFSLDYIELPIVLKANIQPVKMHASLTMLFMVLTGNQCKVEMIGKYYLYNIPCYSSN